MGADRGEAPTRDRALSRESDMKDHIQKDWYQNIHPALRYRALLSLAQSGTEPPEGVEPPPGQSPQRRAKDIKDHLQKVW